MIPEGLSRSGKPIAAACYEAHEFRVPRFGHASMKKVGPVCPALKGFAFPPAQRSVTQRRFCIPQGCGNLLRHQRVLCSANRAEQPNRQAEPAIDNGDETVALRSWQTMPPAKTLTIR
jgi:hypothetical protein